MRFDEAILWGDKFIQTTLKYKARSEQEFINSGGTPELYRILQNSKAGNISITKISNNSGYLDSGDSFEGVTAAFGEGLSLYISDTRGWFRTSTIQKINWDEGTFTTLNSEYRFVFNENSDYTEYES